MLQRALIKSGETVFLWYGLIICTALHETCRQTKYRFYKYTNKLHKIFNRNTFKVGYKCMENVPCTTKNTITMLNVPL